MKFQVNILRDYTSDDKNKNATKFSLEISPLYRTLWEDFKNIKFIGGNWTSFLVIVQSKR